MRRAAAEAGLWGKAWPPHHLLHVHGGPAPVTTLTPVRQHARVHPRELCSPPLPIPVPVSTAVLPLPVPLALGASSASSEVTVRGRSRRRQVLAATFTAACSGGAPPGCSCRPAATTAHMDGRHQALGRSVGGWG